MDDCADCAEALLRVLTVRDGIDLLLWGQEPDLLRGVDLAIAGLQATRTALRAAGWEPSS